MSSKLSWVLVGPCLAREVNVATWLTLPCRPKEAPVGSTPLKLLYSVTEPCLELATISWETTPVLCPSFHFVVHETVRLVDREVHLEDGSKNETVLRRISPLLLHQHTYLLAAMMPVAGVCVLCGVLNHMVGNWSGDDGLSSWKLRPYATSA